MPIEESTIMLSVICLIIGAFLNQVINLNQKILEVKIAIENLDPNTDNTDELNDIKQILTELKGMINVLAYYQQVLRPPKGQT
jgi:hypothetical protein